MKYLVETALLGHGLLSVDNDLILSLWPDDVSLAWIENGKVKIGNISEFIPLRKNSKGMERLDGLAVKRNEFNNKNAFLTASGTMEVARNLNCSLVVTAGIGGIGDIIDEKFCYDLTALSEMEITLIATSFKDMLDIQSSFNWLHENGVNTYGYNTTDCNGYIFMLEPVKIGKKIREVDLKNIKAGCSLILNPIPEEKRLKDLSILEGGILAGKDAEKRGEYYHPAANGYFDKSSKGLSSRIQLEALISNINMAKTIIINE
jgi:pseudouridine-5'-phosphate glycosidase